MRDDSSGLLIDRLAASIIDESLPLKDVEKELRGSVAEVAVKKRGLGKREVANRCGVTEKSIDNYLKEARANPKSPEREISRLLQDGPLSLEEIYEGVRPILCHGRHFTLDDAKRALEKLIRTGGVEELPGKRYQGADRPVIAIPASVDAYRDLVDEKARDLDYIILRQKEVAPTDLPAKGSQHFSRVVGDSSLVRIDFTAEVPEEKLPEFYEKVSEEIARLTLKYEKKKGRTRVRIIIGMRTMALVVAALLGALFFVHAPNVHADGSASSTIDKAGRSKNDSWELDSRAAPGMGGGGGQSGQNPTVDVDDPIDPYAQGDNDRRNLPAVFLTGDANLDRTVDMSDAIAMIDFIARGADIPCENAADVDRDGVVSYIDPIRLIRFLFAGDGSVNGIGHEVEVPSNAEMVLPCAGL